MKLQMMILYTAFEGENNIVAVTYKVPTLDGRFLIIGN